MVDAILYRRTEGTIKGAPASQYYEPTSLLAGDKLEFTFPDNILEGIGFDYVNNVVDQPVPIGDGTRKINKTDNGIRSIDLVINGVFKNPKSLSSDIAKLTLISSSVQTDAKHIFGRVGFYSPNAPDFSLDPNATTSAPATRGYTVSGFHLGYVGQKTTRYDFQIKLSYGGIF